MIVSPDQVSEYLTLCAQAGLTPMISGSPGCGKSSIVRAFQGAHNLVLVDERLSTYGPEDINGFGRIKEQMNDAGEDTTVAQFIPFETFPLEGRDEIPKGKAGWLVFLDEFNSAHPSVQAAA